VFSQEMPHFQRKEILLQVANELKERKEEFAYVLCIEAGKPIKDGRVELEVFILPFLPFSPFPPIPPIFSFSFLSLFHSLISFFYVICLMR
jgi:hypothetical protein